MIIGKRTYPNEKFDFLGYTFRPRRSKNRKGKFFINFSPAVSNKAAKAIRDRFRSWNLHQRSDKAIEDLSRMFNPIIRGWLQYYGRYYRSALYPPMRELDRASGPLGQAEIQEAARPSTDERHTGSRASRDAIRSCSPTGRWGCGVAPWWELYEPRGSRTVLREPRGETPRGYSP